jgi:hypothetical protein
LPDVAAFAFLSVILEEDLLLPLALLLLFALLDYQRKIASFCSL